MKRPIYAGAYAYGRTQSQRLPGQPGKVLPRHQPREKWIVLKPEAHEGYITWPDYLANQAQLAANRQLAPMAAAGPQREGLALLQGIVFCARCGRPLHPRYRDKPIYVCEAHTRTLARRRYEQVDPANRLVAAELERRW